MRLLIVHLHKLFLVIINAACVLIAAIKILLREINLTAQKTCAVYATPPYSGNRCIIGVSLKLIVDARGKFQVGIIMILCRKLIIWN